MSKSLRNSLFKLAENQNSLNRLDGLPHAAGINRT